MDPYCFDLQHSSLCYICLTIENIYVAFYVNYVSMWFKFG